MRKTYYLTSCLLSVLLLAGCNSNMLKLKGRIVKGGQPYIVTPQEGSFRIVFAPITPPSPEHYDSYSAMYNSSDGTFQVTGKDGKGLPPGKYKVGLELMRKKSDLFHGKYAPNKTPFIFDITSNTGEVVLDLDKEKEDKEKES